MTAGCDDAYHCATCADEGIAMRVVAVDEARGLALCAAPGGERSSGPSPPATRCSSTPEPR